MRRFILLGIMVSLLPVCIYLLIKAPPERVQPPVESIQPDIKLEGFTLIETQGKLKRWSLASKSAVVCGEMTKLKDIELKIFNGEKPILELAAESGTLNRKAQTIKAHSKVVAKGRDGLTLTTSALLWDPAKGLITTEGRFALRKDGIRIKGEALKMDPGMERVEAKEFTQDEPIRINAATIVWDKAKGVTILKGDVVIVHGRRTLMADEVRAFGPFEAPTRFTGTGEVRLSDYKAKTTVTSGYIEYDSVKGYAIFKENPVLVKDGDGSFRVSSRSLECLFEEKRINAMEEVVIHYLDFIAYSNLATYKDGKLILTGEPRLRRSTATFMGEKIIIHTQEDRMEIRGDVRATLPLSQEGQR